MSYACIHTACICGPLVVPVRIEVDIQPGLPHFTIVGMPDQRIAEAKQRVRAAIKNSGISFPLGRIIVNLSPADVPKQGTGFDLGIALGILQATEKIKPISPTVWVVGGLSLTGLTQRVRFLSPLLREAKLRKVAGCIIPASHKSERENADCPVAYVSSLTELIQDSAVVFKKVRQKRTSYQEKSHYLIDEIRGQEQAKRVLQIALTGRHNLLLSGPPGSGKTLLAQAAGELLPLLCEEEWQEVAQMYGIAEEKILPRLHTPFRAPHPATPRNQIMGGHHGKPGEISLAHKGILFLDEFPEFSREVRESLRQPLESRIVRVPFANRTYPYPADIMLIAAQNACPCGLLGVEGQNCRCLPYDLLRYSRALSQPILDRIELYCFVPRLDFTDWQNTKAEALSGKEIALRVKKAHNIQFKRYKERIFTSRLSPSQVRYFLKIDQKSAEFIEKVSKQLYCSGRTISNFLKVARSIADLGESLDIQLVHLQEAVMYRYRPPQSV